jgi:ribosomal protein L15
MAGHDHQSGMTMQHGKGMQGMHDVQGMQGMHGGHGGGQMHGAGASAVGQDAFGAIQEVVRVLEADPKTDWSKVDLETLRQHLIDMNEVTLNANATARTVEGGIEVAVTGGGRTLAAIQRMLPAHAKEIDGLNGWRAKAETMANGVRLSVTSNDAREVQHIRGLGFIGLLVSGSHHQPHHLAMAKGEMTHAH